MQPVGLNNLFIRILKLNPIRKGTTSTGVGVLGVISGNLEDLVPN